MPFRHLLVGLAGEGFPWEDAWKGFAVRWVGEVEPLDCFLEERNMFLWF